MPGLVIRKYREMRNYSQEYVARKMGISQNAYSKIENNITQLTVKHIKAISRILEVSILELLKDEFEIHRPGPNQTGAITKETLLEAMDAARNKLREKNSEQHESYPTILHLLQSVDQSLSNVH